MRKILNFLSKEIQGLHQAAFILASASVGSKVLALLRDRLLASTFGAGKTLDIYYASFRIPDFLYVFSLFLVSSTALIPLILRHKEKSFEKSTSFVNGIFTVYFIFICLTAVLAFFAMPFLIKPVAPGFSFLERIQLIKLSRILLLSPFLLGLSNLVSSVAQSFKRFLVYAFSGILYNAGIIVGLTVFFPRWGLNGIIFGIVFGALLHFLIQATPLISLNYIPRFIFRISLSEVREAINLSFPRTLGLSLNQFVLSGITAIASYLSAGSIAVFNLSVNLQSIPLDIIALSYSVAAFPHLAYKFLHGEKDKFFEAIITAGRHLIFWLLPITVLFIILRAQIVRVILGAGAFSWTDTRLTAASLALLSSVLFGQGMIYLLVRAFYAAGKTRIPLFINLASSFFIIFSSFLFLRFFKFSAVFRWIFESILRVTDVDGTIMLVLPLSYALGTLLNLILICVFFEREFNCLISTLKQSFIEVLSASVVIGFVTFVLLGAFDNIFDIDTFAGIFMQGFLSGFLGLVAGFFSLKIIKNKELEEIISAMRRRIPKRKIIGPEPEELP